MVLQWGTSLLLHRQERGLEQGVRNISLMVIYMEIRRMEEFPPTKITKQLPINLAKLI